MVDPSNDKCGLAPRRVDKEWPSLMIGVLELAPSKGYLGVFVAYE